MSVTKETRATVVNVEASTGTAVGSYARRQLLEKLLRDPASLRIVEVGDSISLQLAWGGMEAEKTIDISGLRSGVSDKEGETCRD